MRQGLLFAPSAPASTAAVGPDEWKLAGLCAQTDPEAFFPEKGGSTREARAVCGACPVAAECLEYALAHDERFGIWGGTSERERQRLRRGEPVRSRAPRNPHPTAAHLSAKEPCGCGQVSCSGLVGRSTRNAHHARLRRVAARAEAA